ncbi:uncharacterized protein LOC126833040 isoform X2 [Adelges cooleyi]|uniref:uncharacterized protein LOC126833040 isoform X2 n=1 Tax=Adelges cooleyi TaxID=133065 RepID=UPI00217F2B21|nr:uncharacterized protein LOC126833040 isoform X2 [Adelges cooleyi]
MFFKFSILLLYFILAAISVLGETEDENKILRYSFNNCRKWLSKSLDSTISVPQFWYYMGKSKNDIETIYAYLDKNPAADKKRAHIILL